MDDSPPCQRSRGTSESATPPPKASPGCLETKSLADIEARVSKAIKARKGAGAGAGDLAVAKKRKVDALAAAAERDGGEQEVADPDDEEADDEDDGGAPLKKNVGATGGGAPLKRPAAAKRPAATAPAVACVHGRPALSKEPTHYNGGRLYFTTKKGRFGAFRVYKRSSDKVESIVTVKGKDNKSMNDAWKAALDLVDADPRHR